MGCRNLDRAKVGLQAGNRWQHPYVDEDWKVKAACRTENPDLWFPEVATGRRRYDPQTRLNKRIACDICRSCPVKTDCLEYALAIDARHGIWGGTTEWERARLPKTPPETGNDMARITTRYEYRCTHCHIRIRTDHPVTVTCIRCERVMTRWD